MFTRIGRMAVAVMLLFTLLAFQHAPSRTAAHALLSGSTPAAGAILAAPPATIELLFAEAALAPPVSTASVQLNGAPVAMAAPTLDAGGVRMTLALAPGTGAGVYTVGWNTVSAADGDAASGSFQFTVSAGAMATGPSAVTTGDGRADNAAHGVPAAVAALALAQTGAHARGAGFVQLFGGPPLRQPTVFLSSVAPRATFLVQVCTESEGGPATCAGATVTSDAAGQINGATVSLLFAGVVNSIVVTNSADADESYVASLDGVPDTCIPIVTADGSDCLGN